MFSPGTKRASVSSGKELSRRPSVLDSPTTPVTVDRRYFYEDSIPNRPSTGTPAPWAPRLSVLARIPQATKSERRDETDPIKPVYIGEFPHAIRDEQASLLHRRVPVQACVSGGLEKDTSLAWIICGDRLFIWNYMSPASSMNCTVLELPQDALRNEDIGKSDANSWFLCIVSWESPSRRTTKAPKHFNPTGIVICNRKTQSVIYWPDIYSEGNTASVTGLAAPDGKSNLNSQRLHMFNSFIASAVPNTQFICVALACSSNGELWQFHCSPTGIDRKKFHENIVCYSFQQGDTFHQYPRSLIWRFPHKSVNESERQFFLLTNNEVQCFCLKFNSDICVSKLWSYEIIGTDGDLGMKKDLAGQKGIWPLDMQVGNCGKVITILIATFCKDRISSSTYTQYSLLTMQYKSGLSTETMHERILEKKNAIQVIIPKARADDDFLFSMRLRVGGKPLGSATVISGDGTATVCHYYRNSTRLYQFDLPYDGGKVVDASVLPSADDEEAGAWVVLTEKAGIWAIPEKAVVLGGVEPPERSLSRRGSSNERSAQEERRNLSFASTVAPRRVSSEAWDAKDKQKAVVTGIGSRTAHDEESESLLSHLFNDFLSSGKVDSSLERLRNSASFEREGETNVFARMSKSIVDTLAKHWTTTRGAEILAMAVVSSQLIEKQHKHKTFLQFLALSKCHEELCSQQRYALQIILEHGEKLAAMIQLRELQNMISQNRLSAVGSSNSSGEIHMSAALWDVIQLVGKRARQNTVLLMDRDNAEVFYSKVSDLEDFFYCLYHELEYVIGPEQPFRVQIQRACELSRACVTIVQAAFNYRDENHLWYPPPEGLTPWYSQPVVRNGLWCIASLMLRLLNEASGFDKTIESDLYHHLVVLAEVLLEAYAAAVTAKIERVEEHKGLLNEYWGRRDALLDALYQQVKELMRNPNKGTEEQNEEAINKISSRLLSIAKQHGCFRTMWRICSELNNPVLLRNLMHESMGPDGGFSSFVFKQLHENRQFSKLLRLGEEFPEELSIFLKQHPDLLWLHEVFLHQFSLASETLHELALNQEKGSPLAAEEEGDRGCVTMELTLSDRKRLLYLSKIAAMAEGKSTNFGEKVSHVDADLKILILQEEIMKLISPSEAEKPLEQELLHPEDLIKLCLGGKRELSLLAFSIFAWTSSSFRKSHRSLLEECWRNAADQDDWSEFYRAYVDEGWSDAEKLQKLRNTMLCQASRYCYGPDAKTFEEGFEHVLPLRLENLEGPTYKDSGPSVESILMHHKDFPDASELMLTAIMLGSEQDDPGVEEGPSQME